MIFKAHAYQERAVAWVESHPRCLLFLEMGLGKSVVTLTAVDRLIRHGEAERVLVVAPKKVAESTWSSEAAKWDHLSGLRVSVVTGTPAQRLSALDADADVYVIGRDTVVWLEGQMKGRQGFDMVVLDELTSFKNPRSLRFKALRRMLPFVARVVGLTGTPTSQGLKYLWAQVFCIDGGERLGRSVTHYRRRWFNCVEHNNIIIRMTPKPGAEEEICGLISDIALTMRAEDYLNLPSLVEVDVPVVLPDAKARAYRKFVKDRVAEALAETGGDVSAVTAASAAALTGKLSQWANGAVYADDGSVVTLHDEKLDALAEILEADESPVLCFFQYRHDASRIVERFSSLCPRLYGSAQDLEDWNAGRVRLMLAHPASTAFGSNMQWGGHRIVWFSTGWNLELYEQANARLHRQGQTMPVTVHRLIALGTVDERMVVSLRAKGQNQARMLRRLAFGEEVEDG